LYQRRVGFPTRHVNKGYSPTILPASFYSLLNDQLQAVRTVGTWLAPDESLHSCAGDRCCVLSYKKAVRGSADRNLNESAVWIAPRACRVCLMDQRHSRPAFGTILCSKFPLVRLVSRDR